MVSLNALKRKKIKKSQDNSGLRSLRVLSPQTHES
jgi:hypothetical protein